MKTRHKIMSFLLSGAMVFSLLQASAIGTVKAASVNYALTATATASGSETSAFGPEKAKDGDATTKTRKSCRKPAGGQRKGGGCHSPAPRSAGSFPGPCPRQTRERLTPWLNPGPGPAADRSYST